MSQPVCPVQEEWFPSELNLHLSICVLQSAPLIVRLSLFVSQPVCPVQEEWFPSEALDLDGDGETDLTVPRHPLLYYGKNMSPILLLVVVIQLSSAAIFQSITGNTYGLCLYHSVFVIVTLCLCYVLSLSLSVSVTLCLCLSVTLSLSLCHSLSLSRWFCHGVRSLDMNIDAPFGMQPI